MSLSIFRRISFAVALAILVVAASAAAADESGSTGGASMPGEPEVVSAVCEDETPWKCARGAHLTLSGDSLADAREVRFVGRRGRRDDRIARPSANDDQSVEVVVPRGAKTGPIAVLTDVGKAVTPQAVEVTPGAAPRSSPEDGVFPIAGRHSYGTETNRFGGGRNHQGQDVLAKCGLPLVAVYDAVVQHRAFQSRAGNYVVLQTSDGASFAYMHLQSPSTLRKGDVVNAGDPVGKVGDTGDATTCHLHFEQWTAPGWYEGGHAIDPLPLLKSLDR